jgi:hypothetical protein
LFKAEVKGATFTVGADFTERLEAFGLTGDLEAVFSAGIGAGADDLDIDRLEPFDLPIDGGAVTTFGLTGDLEAVFSAGTGAGADDLDIDRLEPFDLPPDGGAVATFDFAADGGAVAPLDLTVE